MDRRIGVQAVDCGQELVLGRLGRQPQDRSVHPGRLAGGLLVADVDLAGRIVADQDDGQAGHDPGFERESRDIRRHLAANLLGQGSSIENLGGHERSPRLSLGDSRQPSGRPRACGT